MGSQLTGAKKAGEELGKFGIELYYFLYDFNSESFQEMFSKVLDFECEGLLFSPILHDKSILFLKQYKNKNTSVVMIDSDINNNICHFYIGKDAFNSFYPHWISL